MHPSINPSRYPRRILLAVTGLSPQVVTETLYGLTVGETNPLYQVSPTEVHVITTAQGAELVWEALLCPKQGKFWELLKDYPQLGKPSFEEQNIHVIHDDKGNPLPDIRTPLENANAADSITAVLAELTRDPAAALHVSIAGGRKTMGFYLGYVFSMFARPQDALSHVLVSEGFENHPDFYYLPPEPRQLRGRDGQMLDTQQANITVAHIPVVRLRHGQPEGLLKGHASFSETVTTIQTSIQPPSLYINLGSRKVICGDKPVKLQAALLAWLAWWAEQQLNDTGQQSWRTADAKRFLYLYARVVGRHSAVYDNAEKRLSEGMEKSFFQENNAKLERALRDQLGRDAFPYLLTKTGKRPFTMRGLGLPARFIKLDI